MNKTFSEYGQDTWIINYFNQKRNGFFVDVGCVHPFKNNNTALLDIHYDWTGLCVGTHDIESFDRKVYGNLNWSSRKNSSFIFDKPNNIDYENVLESLGCRNGVDCLSIGKDLSEDAVRFIDIFPFERFPVSLLTIDMNISDVEHLDIKIVDLGYTLTKQTNTTSRFYRKKD